jgi:hypothetical protein
VLGPERICPNNDPAALLLLLLLKFLQLPVDPYGKFAIRQKHVHRHVGIPQACVHAMRMRKLAQERR